MKYTSEDINVIIECINDYNRINGVINSYKESKASYDRLMLDLKRLSGFSISNNVDENYLDFYYEDMILTLYVENEKDCNYYLTGGIQVIDKNGYCIGDFNGIEDMQEVFHDYVWSRIDNYVNSCDNLTNDYNWYKVETGDKEDLKQAMFESIWSCNGNDFDVKKEVDKLDNFIKMQEMKKEKKHTGYDLEVMLYLALEIKEILYNEKHFFIDIYCEEIKKIYEDFEKHDDANMSLLDSINKYIDENKESIKERFKDAFDTF